MNRVLDETNKQNSELQEEVRKRRNDEEFREKKWREGLLAAEQLEAEMRSEILQLKFNEEQLKKEIGQLEERRKI
jgi:hypothetical protein